MTKLDYVAHFGYIAVFDCERTESFYSLLPKYIQFAFEVVKGVF